MLVHLFFDPLVVAELGWKVRKNAVERPVRLAGGKPGLVVTMLLVEFYGPKCKLYDTLHYISTKIIRSSSLF